MVVPKAVRVALPAAVTLVVAAKVSVTCAGTVTTAARASAPGPLPDGAVAGSRVSASEMVALVGTTIGVVPSGTAVPKPTVPPLMRRPT